MRSGIYLWRGQTYIGQKAVADAAGVLPHVVSYGVLLTKTYDSARKNQGARCLQHQRAPNRNGSHEDRVMAKRQLPSPEVLRQLLRYEPETGKLFWKERSPEMFPVGKRRAEHTCSIWNASFAGREAFTSIDNHGYAKGTIFQQSYAAHRVAFVLIHGRWPDHQVDHINGIRSDNRSENLREATSSQNKMNSKVRCDNSSGYKGVSFHKASNLWRANIRLNGKQRCIGYFKTAEEANAAYQKASEELHGEYRRAP